MNIFPPNLNPTSSTPPDPPRSLRIVRRDQLAVTIYPAETDLLLIPIDAP